MIRIGQKLREERLLQGYTLEDISHATKIRVSFLSAIEKGEYARLPSRAYIQGFVKNYIQFLGLPPKEYIALFRREFNENEHIQVLPRGFAQEVPLTRFRFGQAAIVTTFLIILLVGYLIFQNRYSFLNPPLEVTIPKEGNTVSEDVTIQGKTDPNATVVINDIPISLDNEGTFIKQMSLFPGKNTIRVVSQNRFGKQTVIERHIEVK